ncbi:hypothetical protein [Ferrimonas lipolytica]|uniref:Secreted protein n=1 Tax=Ferrimonas lipolytica TaxID=2724191 RepID=A0A6H1U8R9_9GAMM|nr:hypothetical protein [Ferrimonas lipolytica]QIZ75441.1 hypothetical protein HER31_00075 [Ferrimonas lipolytica]
MKAVIVTAIVLMATPMTTFATGGGGGGGYTKEFAPGYYNVTEKSMDVAASSALVGQQGASSADINTLLEQEPTAAGEKQKAHHDKHHKCTCEDGIQN